jgi:predicted amidohydrolase
MPSPPRIAIAQISMHWTTTDNLTAIERAMQFASAQGARLCGFSELAVTGFHREIAREARPERVGPAIRSIRAQAARLSLGVAVGAPTFADDGSRFNTHLLIDEQGATVTEVRKRGLTDAEALFFAPGATRPIAKLQGLRCSAVICREVGDLDNVRAELPPGTVDLIFVPGALRQDPAKARTDPPEYVADIQRLAAATQAHVVHTNWPNALNRPQESVDAGGSVVADPRGDLLLRLPMQASGIGLFTLGDRHFDWHPQ